MNQEPVFRLSRDILCNCLEVIYSNYTSGSCFIRFVLKKPADKAFKALGCSSDLKMALYGRPSS